MSEWKNFSLGEVAEVTKLAGFEFTKYISYVDDGEIIALRALNLRNGILDLTNVKKIKKSVSDKLIRSKLFANDILLTYTGNGYGDCALVSENDKYHLAPNICKISPNTNIVVPYYLYSYIRSKAFKIKLDNSISGSAQPTIPMKTLRILKVPLFDLLTQKKIAAVLSALDDKIELNNAINRNLEEQAQAIYKKICLRAKLAPLSELIEIVESGSRPKGGATTSGIPSIGAEKIDGFGRYDYSNEKFIDTDYFKRLKRGILFSGDVMLYKDGAYTGKSSMALDGFPHEICAVNEHVFLLRTKDSRAQFFLYFTLRNEDVYKKIHVLACGKAAQPGLNQKELMCVTSFLPEEEVIQKFESVVSPMMHSIALNALENKKLGDVRDSLLPRLMSGEIDVSEVEI